MKELLQKIKVLYQKLKMARSSYAGSGIKIARDWKIFLTFTSISLIIAAIFAFYFYIEINQGKFFVLEKNDTKKEVKIDSVLLKKVVDEINLREVSFLEIRQEKSTPPDPSL